MPQAEPIRNMFNNIAGSYDLLNDLLSLGIHRLWKRKLIGEIIKSRPHKVLDCATGTGDIAISIKDSSPQTEVVGTDFSKNMLEVAKQKTNTITWEVQDVTNLPYTDNQFDVSSISYGIRNVEDMDKGLQELARVSKEKFCILEFGQPQNPLFKAIYFGVMKYFIPLIGMLFNKKEAYQYLIDSSLTFPSADKMVDRIKSATGLKNVSYQPLMGGITYLYTARKS